MSKILQIRNLPDDLYDQLAFRAEREGRSLNQQAIIELQQRFQGQTGSNQRGAVLARIAKDLREGRSRTLSPPPEDVIRKDRER